MIWNYLSQIITIFLIIIHMNNSTHGLCKECLTVNISEMHTEKVTKCFSCQKDPTLLYNQDPYCTACYLMTVSSPTKS